MTTRIEFDAKEDPLQSILTAIGDRTTQLPDFQRGWVWDDAHIRSLLASISQGYPIGAVMLLQAGSDDVLFKTRVVEGVDGAASAPPATVLILDGQQRLTSLKPFCDSSRASRSAAPRATSSAQAPSVMAMVMTVLDGKLSLL